MAAVGGRTVRDLRRESRGAVLQRLYLDGPMSRHALGPATGLSSGSVSNVVTGLLADGLVEEAGVIGADAGRPRRLLRIRPDSGRLIGVDVGETRVRVELLDLGLAELARSERPLGPRGYDVDAVVGHVADGIADVLRAAGLAPGDLLGVGVGVPGIVEDGGPRGAVVHGQTVGWDAVPLERLLRATGELPAHVPYFIDNGAKAAGQAEMWFGGGRGARNAVVVLFGSGVGACVVTEEAARGRAVEWGHLTVRVAGRRCRCGALGCLEAYAGASALIARWREAGGRPSAGAGEEQALTELLAAARGDGGGGNGASAETTGLGDGRNPGWTGAAVGAEGRVPNGAAVGVGGGGRGAGLSGTASGGGGRTDELSGSASLDGGRGGELTSTASDGGGQGAELVGTGSGGGRADELTGTPSLDGGRAADFTSTASRDDRGAADLTGTASRDGAQGAELIGNASRDGGRGAASRVGGRGAGAIAVSRPGGSRSPHPAGTAGTAQRWGPAAVGTGGERCPDPVAVAVLAEAAEYLGAGLSDLINLFQPERVLIGGWAGLQLGDAFLDQVRAHALARALRHPAGRVRIELGRLGPDAVTVGAAVLPLAAFFSAGGHRPAPETPPAPAWRAVAEGRSV